MDILPEHLRVGLAARKEEQARLLAAVALPLEQPRVLIASLPQQVAGIIAAATANLLE